MKDKHDNVTMELFEPDNGGIMNIDKSTEYLTANEMLASVIPTLLQNLLVSRIDEEYPEMVVEVGHFDNCREYGNTYRVPNGEQDISFCVYEHRNSDSIIINGCKTENVRSYGPYNGGSKYDYLESFSYNQVYDCAYLLAAYLVATYLGVFDEGLFND